MGPITMPANADSLILTWDVAGASEAWCQENYSVYITNNIPDITIDSNTLVWTETIDNVPGILDNACGQWASRSADIDSLLSGQDIYITFRHHNVTNMYQLYIDNVMIVDLSKFSADTGTYSTTVTDVFGTDVCNTLVDFEVSKPALSVNITNITIDYNSCDYYGCTDTYAIIFDSNASVDDGSCQYLVTGCMDSTASNYNSNATIDDSSCINQDGIYYINLLNEVNDISRITTSDEDGDTNNWLSEQGYLVSESYINDIGPLNPDNLVTFGPITIPADSTALLTWQISGSDPFWCQENYSVYINNSSNIIIDSNTLVLTEKIQNDGDACGQWASRSADIISSLTDQDIYITFRHHDVTDMFRLFIDNVIIVDNLDRLQLIGCTDTTAINYNSNARIDDSSCQYLGCMDSTASNYDSNATIDDSSCICGILGDLNGDGSVDILDVYSLVDYILSTGGTGYVNNTCDLIRHDVNEDGVINILDIIKQII